MVFLSPIILFLYIDQAAYPSLIESLLENSRVASANRSRLSIQHAGKTVAMDEKPSQALGRKTDTSMWCAFKQVADKEADACVSAGNTGSLMAMGLFAIKMGLFAIKMGLFAIKMFAGIDPPAIAVHLPTRKLSINDSGSSLLLDYDANMNCTSEHLYQFSIMGAQLGSSVHGLTSSRVALLNVGSEETKGNQQVRLAHHLLKERLVAHDELRYIGFVEGGDLFSGRADVIVCAGFVGNIALKTTEGTAYLIKDGLYQVFQQNFSTRLLYLMMQSFIKHFNRRVDPVLYNGDSFLGFQGTVIKSHNGADEEGFYTAVCQAFTEVQGKLPQKLSLRVEGLSVS